MKQLVYRFGEEDDAAEILALLNESYALEFGDENVAFKKKNPHSQYMTTPQFLETFEEGKRMRWYLVEDANANLELLGAVCFRLTEKDSAEIISFAIDKKHQNYGIGSTLLRTVENVFDNLCCRYVCFTIAHWRVDITNWATKRKFIEFGGGMWLDSTELSRETRYIVYRKQLKNAQEISNVNVIGNENDGAIPDFEWGKLDRITSALDTASGNTESDNLESLVRLLVTQLRGDSKTMLKDMNNLDLR